MAAVASTWLVGSQNLAAQSYSIDGTGYGIAAGHWYLTHATASLSILAGVLADMTTEGLSNPYFYIREDRLLEMGADATFTFSWTGTTLRNLCGYTGNLSGASSYVSDGIPRLLWSPGYPALFATDDGQSAYDMDDAVVQVAASGIVDVDYVQSLSYNELRWTDVMRARMRAADSADPEDFWGTFDDFRGLVLRPGYRFQIYEEVTEDSSSTDEVTLPSALGTYQIREVVPGRYRRVSRTAGSRWDPPELKVIEVADYA